MSNRPKVSVVIPSYNARDYILEAIESIRIQCVEGVEIIVVDDGSTDDSMQLLRKHAPEVRVISQQNSGPASARNRGIAEAHGEYIGFLDADDIWLPGKLTAQIRELDINPGLSVCYGRFCPWMGDDKERMLAAHGIESVPVNIESVKDYLLPVTLLFDSVVWTPTAIVKRAAVKDALYFDETLDVGEDYDLWLRLALEFQFSFLPVPVALYRDNPASITKRVPRCNFEKLVVERGVERLQDISPRALMKYLLPSIHTRLADLDYSYGRACFMAHRREDAYQAMSSFLVVAKRPSAIAMWLLSTSPWLFEFGHRLLSLIQRSRRCD